MNPWKVILAVLVIFCSGIVVGGLVAKKAIRLAQPQMQGGVPHSSRSVWHLQQREFLRRMEKEVNLSAEQKSRIENILKESQERTKGIREKIAPEMREELKKVREQMRAELNPDQQIKFEEAIKYKPKEGGRRQRTNFISTNVPLSPPKP